MVKPHPREHIVSEWAIFNISKIHKKLKQHPIHVKNYTAHPHDMVHAHAQIRGNTTLRLRVIEQKRNATVRWTDRI